MSCLPACEQQGGLVEKPLCKQTGTKPDVVHPDKMSLTNIQNMHSHSIKLATLLDVFVLLKYMLEN